MKFSRPLKSSTQSIPSPDGAYIATVFPSQLSIRETRSLEILRVISLPPDLAVSWFLWSESSHRILVASLDNIRVYSITNAKFSATISPAGSTKVTLVTFGANNDEVLVFSEYGLKVSIYNLSTSKAVDINAPKFYNAGVAKRGYSYRPHTSHLALVTRSGGKDVVSIHNPGTLDVMRSWWPQTIDAQGVYWSADGKWLVLWESGSQGHRLFVYTADGHLFKTWNGPLSTDEDIALGAGIRIFEWCENGAYIAIGDFSARVTLLSVPSFSEAMSLVHPATVNPAESIQIWQEQIVPSQNGGYDRDLVKATQSICPPTSPTTSSTETKTGTSLLIFDKSNTLLGTRTENMPTTLWIWDIGSTRSLRAVIILHSPITKATWHPTIDELLLIRCEGDRGLVYLWDPSWETPKIIDLGKHIVGGKFIGKTAVRWLNFRKPVIFFGDEEDCMLVSIFDSDDGEEGGDGEDGEVPWKDAEMRGVDIYGEREESPLQLVPAADNANGNGNGKRRGRSQVQIRDLIEEEESEDGGMGMSGGSEEVEDTFHFRRFVD